MALEIEYRAETEDDMNDLAGSLLKAQSISHMGECLLNKHGTAEFYELQDAFQTIRLLIEPAITFFNYDGVRRIQERGRKKPPRTA
jgi:hypothetical protein